MYEQDEKSRPKFPQDEIPLGMYKQYIKKVQTAFLCNLNLYFMLSNFYRKAITVIIQFCLPHGNKDSPEKAFYFPESQANNFRELAHII